MLTLQNSFNSQWKSQSPNARPNQIPYPCTKWSCYYSIDTSLQIFLRGNPNIGIHKPDQEGCKGMVGGLMRKTTKRPQSGMMINNETMLKVDRTCKIKIM